MSSAIMMDLDLSILSHLATDISTVSRAKPFSSIQPRVERRMGALTTPREYDGIVIGAGPGGLAAIAGLLDVGLERIIWVDRTFGGGRLNEKYREISSNTKTGVYLDAIRDSETCSRIIDGVGSPNAIQTLERLDREDTCRLALAGDAIKMLEAGLLSLPGVEQCLDDAGEARQENGVWSVSLASSSQILRSRRLFLCTGSHPKIPSFHKQYNPALTVLDLDECMPKSHLPDLLPPDQKSTVAIIGNSHSGLLCCWNFHQLAQEGKRDVKVRVFRRHPIRYAEYRDDGVVYDNTGLKGATADWARETLEDRGSQGDVEQIDLGEDEQSVYRRYLPDCTHIVYAVGYQRAPLPRVFVRGKRVDEELEFDMHSSGFRIQSHPDAQTDGRAGEVKGNGKEGEAGELIKGLFGCGIAFPEETEDPEGHVEAAVGVAKFFKFAQRVKELWADAG